MTRKHEPDEQSATPTVASVRFFLNSETTPQSAAVAKSIDGSPLASVKAASTNRADLAQLKHGYAQRVTTVANRPRGCIFKAAHGDPTPQARVLAKLA